MKNDSYRYTPPGMDLAEEKLRFAGTSLLAVVLSAITFFSNYEIAVKQIRHGGSQNYETIMNFFHLVEGTMNPFILPALAVAAAIWFRYRYYHQEGKCIYLMRRLPDRYAIWRTCLVQPLKQLWLCGIFMVILLLIYYVVYRIGTPAEAFLRNCLQRIGRTMVC